MNDSEFNMLIKSIDETNARIDKLAEKLRRAANNPAPTVPTYDPTNFPQDAVEGQVAVGSDGKHYWFVNGTWETVTIPPPTVPPMRYLSVTIGQPTPDATLVRPAYNAGSSAYTNDISGFHQLIGAGDLSFTGTNFKIDTSHSIDQQLQLLESGIYSVNFSIMGGGSEADYPSDYYWKIDGSTVSGEYYIDGYGLQSHYPHDPIGFRGFGGSLNRIMWIPPNLLPFGLDFRFEHYSGVDWVASFVYITIVKLSDYS